MKRYSNENEGGGRGEKSGLPLKSQFSFQRNRHQRKKYWHVKKISFFFCCHSRKFRPEGFPWTGKSTKTSDSTLKAWRGTFVRFKFEKEWSEISKEFYLDGDGHFDRIAGDVAQVALVDFAEGALAQGANQAQVFAWYFFEILHWTGSAMAELVVGVVLGHLRHPDGTVQRFPLSLVLPSVEPFERFIANLQVYTTLSLILMASPIFVEDAITLKRFRTVCPHFLSGYSSSDQWSRGNRNEMSRTPTMDEEGPRRRLSCSSGAAIALRRRAATCWRWYRLSVHEMGRKKTTVYEQVNPFSVRM